MSITQFENPEGELISQEDIDSEKFSAKSSRCSCIHCDSIGCFEKRKKPVKDRYQCGICRDHRICSTLSHKDSRENARDLENATKKIVREVVTRETIESLKRVTETMYKVDTKENFRVIAKGQSTFNDENVITKPTKSQISNKIECCKKISKDESEINDKKESFKKRTAVQVPNTDINKPYKADNTATKLSAQVMNVPYEGLNESVSSSHMFTEQNPLPKLNIFKRIKEIYEACSCKVCECISSKPRDLPDDFCKCKPCQCQDCMKLRRTIEEKIKRVPHSGCPCIRCDRKDCRGITKNTHEQNACSCSPDDSIQYSENITERCKCEPCQCIDCKSLGFRTSKTVRLGKVDEFFQRDTCQCSPCECIECKQIYSRINPTIMCSHSADMTKYRSYCHCNNCLSQRCHLGEIETCACERPNRAMRKSFDKKYNDYDVHTVIVDNNSPFNQQEEYNIEKHKTVALFASLKNNYPSNSCNKGVCKCTECECLVCSARNDLLKDHREHSRRNVLSIHNNIQLPTPNMNACKCTPCECEICSKKGEAEDGIVIESKCRCDVCDCLNCEKASLATTSFPISSFPTSSFPTSSFPTSSFPSSSFTPNNIYGNQPAKPIRSMGMNKNCKCNHCDCSNCKKLFSCSSSVKFYSNGKNVERKTARRLRKVMLISPTTSESHLRSLKTCVENVSSTNVCSKRSIETVFRQNLSTCLAHNYATMGNLPNTNNNEVCQLYQDSKEYDVVSDDDVDREIFFKVNNPILDTASFKSIEETPVLDYPCNVTQTTFQTHKINKVINRDQENPIEGKCKRFNIIDEQRNIINSNDSEELLPVFWACCNETSYSRSLTRDKNITCKTTNLSDVVSKCLNKTQYPDYLIHEDSNNKDEEKLINQVFENNEKSKGGDYNQICHNEHIHFCQGSHKYTDSYNTSNIDNNQESKTSIINHSDVSLDYERATRVLWEAKAFSSKLIKMLDSFETANRHFESASQKFKVLHESLLDINKSEFNKTYKTKLGKMPRHVFVDPFEIISEDHHDNKESTDEIAKNENEAEREYEKTTAKPENFLLCDNFQYTEQLTSTNFEISQTEQINKIIVDANDSHENDINLSKKSNSQLQFDKAFNKIDTLTISIIPHVEDSHSINLESSADTKNDSRNEAQIVKVENIKPTIASVTKNFDSVFGDITTANSAVATDDEDSNRIKLSKQEDKQPWQIFKKNLYLNACPVVTRTKLQSPAIELDIKEAINAISFQTTNDNYTKVVSRPNEALTNLQNEVNDLLNMPLLQSSSQLKCETERYTHVFPRGKLNMEVKSMSSTASSQTYDRIITKADKEVYFNIDSETSEVSCEQLKANFTGLRRVSDHTVLVKWNVPKRIADVQGYELLVDGRAVQKIFSPTRSMAVVTCLPHAARVLLTIRTIASADCGHAPASSIVYRPRSK